MSMLRETAINAFMIVFRIIVKFYTIITLPLYYGIQQPWKVLMKSREIRARQIDPNNPYSDWVHIDDLPYHPMIECETIGDAIEKMKELYKMDRKCFGYREILEEHFQKDKSGNVMRLDGKVLKKYRLSDYKWITYGDLFCITDRLGCALLSRGFQRKDKVLFFAETRMENLIFNATIARIGGVIVNVFATLNNAEIIFAINQTELTYCYTTYDQLSRIVEIIPKCPKLKTIIYVEGPIGSEEIPKFPDDVNLWTYTKLIEFGSTVQPMKFQHLGKDDVPFILYTSGTSGPPKGIYATGREVKRAAMAILPIVKNYIFEAERHIYVAYLPQAHILEGSLEVFCALGGVKIGFATPFTLNETAPGLAEGIQCDLKLLKPTVMCAVPLVLDRMRKEIYQKLKSRTPVSTAIFDYLISYKIEWTQKGYDTPIANILLCRKVREQFGGKLKHMVVGSAPLSPELQALIKAALNMHLGQGYGATETCGAATCMDEFDLSYGRVGPPLWGVRIRLVDWEEGGYSASDKPNPRGEIVIGGDGIASGYYKSDNLTKESFFKENEHQYFYSGDIGEMFPDGTLKIIDRKKDLIKLANGEYVSIGNIEATLKNDEFIDNICLIGNGFMDNLIALIVPHEKAFQSLMKQLQLDNASYYEQCHNPKVIQTIHSSLTRTGKMMNLNRREIPAEIYICHENWSPDNEMLTAAMKLKRRVIHKKYQQIIEQMTHKLQMNKFNGTEIKKH